MTEFILNIAKAMHGFQERNNIKAQCLTNTQYLLDCIKKNFPHIKAKARAVFVINEDTYTKTLEVINHVVIDIEDNYVLDPSYETASMKNTRVFGDFVVFKNTLINVDLPFKKILQEFISLNNQVNDMNNGKLVICDKDFYNKQADYVESMYK
jgi:hypothetical protein